VESGSPLRKNRLLPRFHVGGPSSRANKRPPSAEPTMLPDALPQQIDTLLRLPLLEAAQLRELIQHLPDPQAAAQEMVRRGWITQDQYSSLFPGPQQRPTPRETMMVGSGDDAITADAGGEDWMLPVDEEDTTDVPVDG